MEEAQVRRLLDEAYGAELALLAQEFPIYGGSTQKTARKVYGRSKLTAESACVRTDVNLRPAAWGRMSREPCALVEEGENRLVLLLGIGAAKANPAVVELCFGDDQVRISAWAKEGVISQHTAAKAVRACEAALCAEESARVPGAPPAPGPQGKKSLLLRLALWLWVPPLAAMGSYFALYIPLFWRLSGPLSWYFCYFCAYAAIPFGLAAAAVSVAAAVTRRRAGQPWAALPVCAAGHALFGLGLWLWVQALLSV